MVTREQLLKAIEQVESGGRRDAVSPKGARGRMQVMPATARQPGYRVKPARDESEEEYTRVGKDYAMALLKNYGGDLEATLVAYNYGPGNANKWIASGRNKSDLPKETRDYITRVGKELGGKKMARRPLKAIKQKQLSELTKKAIKNPDSADARKVVRELIARGLPVPNKLKGSIGTARAEAGIGSPAGEVPRPKRKPAAPKAKAVPRPKRKPPVPQEEFIGQARAFNAPRGDTVRPASESGGSFLDNMSQRPRSATPQQISAADRERRLARRVSRPGKNPTEAQFSYNNPGRNPTEAEFATPPRPGRNPTEAEFMYMIGQQRPDPSMMTPPMRSVRSRDIDEDYVGRRGLPSLELMSNAPKADGFVGDEPGAPYRSSGGRGEMEGNRGYETLREYFIEDVTPRKSKVMTPFGIIDIDSTEDAYGSGDEITDMQIEMGQKKGGRLKKKKKPATRKKVAAKKKKVAVKKKPVVRKKAVAKKPPMRKKTVAKKPAGRKRAAKRGFGAELRGN